MANPNPKNSPKVEAKIAEVMRKFKTGEVAKECAYVTLATKAGKAEDMEIPALTRTLSNLWLGYMTTGSMDTRGFKQWKKIGRAVKRGERAGYIWAPRMVTTKDKETGEKKRICIGFIPVAVFGADQTDGDPLPYDFPEVVGDLPLVEVAEHWGIRVTARANVLGGSSLGFYRTDGSQINVATDDAHVFMHELSHAAHAKVAEARGQKLKGGQDPWQEIVAEFSAEVLYQIVCPDAEPREGNAYSYIEGYAGSTGMGVEDACLKCLRDVGKVVELILNTADEING
jgi:hypothetical protein